MYKIGSNSVDSSVSSEMAVMYLISDIKITFFEKHNTMQKELFI
jgi:hypothetical protein